MFQVPSFALKIQFGLARLRGFNSLDKLFNFFLVNDFQGQKSLYGKGVKPELLTKGFLFCILASWLDRFA